MTRQEAARVLDILADHLQYFASTDAMNALDTAITALRGPQPDPITGLMPCGCGGKAYVYLPVSAYSLYIIGCERCRVRITFPNKVNEAKNEWNRAMGWREDE